MSKKQHLYEPTWRAQISKITTSLINQEKLNVQLNKSAFEAVGQRGNYSFCLKYYQGKQSNNIGGSAVARDLHEVLEADEELFSLLKQFSQVVFRLSTSFEFSMKWE